MNNLQLFTHERFGDLRIVDRDGKPWFVGNDVAKALRYARPRDAVHKFCKGGVKTALPSASGEQKTIIIPEADMYRLILKSNMPQAEDFQDWVVEDVLPAIRQHGEYAPSRPKEITVDTNTLIALVDRLKLAEDRVDAFRPRVPYGTPSETTGEPRTCLVPSYFRSWRRRILREIDEYQMRLFEFG